MKKSKVHLLRTNFGFLQMNFGLSGFLFNGFKDSVDQFSSFSLDPLAQLFSAPVCLKAKLHGFYFSFSGKVLKYYYKM